MSAPSDASESSAAPCAQDDRRGLGGDDGIFPVLCLAPLNLP